MDVSIVMINYNTFEFARDAIDSILTDTKGLQYEIILIDNQSSDGSGERLWEHFRDKIVYIQAGSNLGTSKAFNLGVGRSTGKYVLWLNTDVLLKDNFIETLFEYMERNSDCGICGGNVFDFDGKPAHSYRKQLPTLKTIRQDLSLFRTVWRRLFGKNEQFNGTGRPMEVGYITGADMMIRRELLDRLGGFDERIFMYAEEVEFTYRVKHDTNYTVVSVPDAHILHLEGASFQGKHAFSETKYRISTKGVSVYLGKSYGIETLKKYIWQNRRAYFKFMLVSILLLKIGKYKEYRTKRAVMREYLKDFTQYVKELGL